MRIVVDYDKCTSNAVCMSLAPEVFEVRDDGYMYVLNDEPGEEFEARVNQAVAECPTGAISLED